MKKTATLKNNSITIIGCGGFIGSHLLDRLIETTSYRIIGIDLVSAKIAPHLKNDRFSFVKMDMHDTASLKPYIERSGTVVLLAALCNPALYNTRTLDVIDVNGTGTIPLVKMAAQAGARLVYFSTSEVYGKTSASLSGRDSDPEACRPAYLLREDESQFILGPTSAQRWSYACAKQLIERVIYAYGKERGLNYTIVRPFNFIGPRMDFLPGIDGEGTPRVLACFLSALIERKPLHLVDGGRNRRCFTWIGDAIEACVKILEKPDATLNQIFNIGNPANETTIAALADLMARLWRRHVPGAAHCAIENISARDFYGPGYEDSDRRLPDISKARALLGWEPKTLLETALDITIKAYVKQYQPVVQKE